MHSLPKAIRRLIDEFSRLPGIGPKSAERLAVHLLHSPDSRIRELGDAVIGMKDGIEFCRTCWHLADRNPCSICENPQRDKSKVCVVEQILDVVAIERSGAYNGVYHVLHGVLSPIHGVGPEQLKLAALEARVRGNGTSAMTEAGESEVGKISEIILATNPSLEGEATALYIMKMLKNYPSVHMTRIARGLPVGGELGYADQVTLTKAMQGRTALSEE